MINIRYNISSMTSIKCGYCDNTFNSVDVWLNHMLDEMINNRYHKSSIKSIKCDYCDKIFHSTDTWLSHTLEEMKILYTQHRILDCMNCEFHAKDICELRTHISLRTCKEGIVRQDKCSNCERLFSKKSSLVNHLKRKACFSKPPMVCPACHKQFSHPGSFRKHPMLCIVINGKIPRYFKNYQIQRSLKKQQAQRSLTKDPLESFETLKSFASETLKSLASEPLESSKTLKSLASETLESFETLKSLASEPLESSKTLECLETLESFEMQDIEELFSPRTSKQLDIEFEMFSHTFEM